MPSDPEKLNRWLSDIHHHIAKAEGFVAGMTYEAFADDDLRVYAVTRCLEIISEASRRLPDDFKARHPTIKWQAMAAAGNIYRHEYDSVAARRVWITLTQSLPPLRVVVAAELAALDRPT
jgi:uncharacterized protein with HEPN domain